MPSGALRDFAVPLRTLDPSDLDVSDLEPVRKIIGDARVVSIGESAHGIREFYDLKHRLLRYLVSELGFTAFVMESGFAEGLAVNEWILGGDGDLTHVAHTGITYGFGDCAEMRAQLQWMRDWNAAHERKVRFYGMDVPGSCTNPGPAISACLARIAPQSGDAELLRLSELGGQIEAIARYAALSAAQRECLSNGIENLVERAAGDDIAYRCALSARYLDDMLSNKVRFGVGRNPRDELMLDNVNWILQRESRIVIGAHNGHLLRRDWQGIPVLGSLLDPILGNDMVVIATTYASGQVIRVRNPTAPPVEWDVSLDELQPPPHSMDALMDSANLAFHIVDLRRVPSECVSAATTMLFAHDAHEVAPQKIFDALVHVRHVTPVAGALETLRGDVARANAR